MSGDTVATHLNAITNNTSDFKFEFYLKKNYFYCNYYGRYRKKNSFFAPLTKVSHYTYNRVVYSSKYRGNYINTITQTTMNVE